MNKPVLIMISGPTAVGKTSVSIQLSKALNTEILSADSRQFYREMQIGTAKPTPEEMDGIKHHFIGHLSVKDHYNISDFENDSLNLLEGIFREKNTAVMVGGSGLYLKAVGEGIDEFPDPLPGLREKLNQTYEQQGIGALQDWLRRLDPEYYAEVDIQNPKRLMRGIEVCETSGNKFSDLRKKNAKQRPFHILKIGLNLPREELFERIHQRTDQMIKDGLVDEVRSLLPYRQFNALNTVGYKEIFRYLDGEISLEQAVTDIKTNTRRYAKRQLTWFKKDEEITWFNPHESELITKIKELATKKA